jgi:hypothetical protein
MSGVQRVIGQIHYHLNAEKQSNQHTIPKFPTKLHTKSYKSFFNPSKNNSEIKTTIKIILLVQKSIFFFFQLIIFIDKYLTYEIYHHIWGSRIRKFRMNF